MRKHISYYYSLFSLFISLSPSLPSSLSPSLSKALVQKGERRHMFQDPMPPAIQRSVNEENLQFMQHRDVYCVEYFEFVRDLAITNQVSVT